jgi:hypothetical protein
LAHQALILRSHSADLWIGNGLGILARYLLISEDFQFKQKSN